ncbi:hypothetical protein MMC27_005432 [Xylographa pallens]|nr:hypothetical protein [Xylographa pallens]
MTEDQELSLLLDHLDDEDLSQPLEVQRWMLESSAPGSRKHRVLENNLVRIDFNNTPVAGKRNFITQTEVHNPELRKELNSILVDLTITITQNPEHYNTIGASTDHFRIMASNTKNANVVASMNDMSRTVWQPGDDEGGEGLYGDWQLFDPSEEYLKELFDQVITTDTFQGKNLEMEWPFPRRVKLSDAAMCFLILRGIANTCCKHNWPLDFNASGGPLKDPLRLHTGLTVFHMEVKGKSMLLAYEGYIFGGVRTKYDTAEYTEIERGNKRAKSTRKKRGRNSSPIPSSPQANTGASIISATSAIAAILASKQSMKPSTSFGAFSARDTESPRRQFIEKEATSSRMDIEEEGSERDELSMGVSGLKGKEKEKSILPGQMGITVSPPRKKREKELTTELKDMRFADCIEDKLRLMKSTQQIDAAFLGLAEEMGSTIAKMKEMMKMLRGSIRDDFEGLREDMKEVLSQSGAMRDQARGMVSAGIGQLVFSHDEIATAAMKDLLEEAASTKDHEGLLGWYLKLS